MVVDRDEDTICAVATPYGRGGISVIRMSGKRALVIARALCAFIPAAPESHKVFYGLLLDTRASQEVDEVLVTYFERGRSFTGEESVEISCHGNPILCERILQALVAEGARLADRGEFTYRAFINGRIDLVQAESVLSLIESQTIESSRISLRQLKGDLSISLESMESDITWCLAHIEAGIDFSEQGIDVIDQSILSNKLEMIFGALKDLVQSYEQGRLLKDGIRVALVGRPNVGKSSLLNRLIEDDRAIVTDIPGTTRDVVAADTIYQEYKLTVFDTAGLREGTQDIVEKLGIERAKATMAEADVILFVVEAQNSLSPEEIEIFDNLDHRRAFVVVNKVDLAGGGRTRVLEPLLDCKKFKDGMDSQDFLSSQVLWVSAFDKKARDYIFDAILGKIKRQGKENTVLLVQARHFECLSRAAELIGSSLQSIKKGTSPEFLALDLKQGLVFIQEVLGKRFDDQIMDRVFREFCIGK